MSGEKKFPNSNAMYERACRFFPGGVNSPVRAFGAVGGAPLFFKKALGAYLYDEDNNEYIDYVASWGPAILGHAHPDVLAAIKHTMDSGLSFGAPTDAESSLAEKIQEILPSMERMRFVSSGTEACMAALRVARGVTGRTKLLKFTGCYHGHADAFLVKAGSGVATFGLPGSPGVPEAVVKDTLTAPFNDLAACEKIFAAHAHDLAAVIVEPFVGNGGFLRPSDEFLPGLRRLCDDSGALLVFDEVMTGFRVALGGTQGLLGITPDLTTLGKIVGGGMPMGVYGGKAAHMRQVAPEGAIYQAGTLSGNPLAVASGLKTLELLTAPGAFEKITALTKKLVNGFNSLKSVSKFPFIADGEGGMFGLYFSADCPRSFEQVQQSNIEAFKTFFWGMLRRGVYLAPSAFEAGFVSLAHSEQDIERTIETAAEVLAKDF